MTCNLSKLPLLRILALAVLISQCTVRCGPLVRSAPEECPLKDGNILNVKLFVQDDTQCRSMCQNDASCQFYKFYSSMEGKPPQCFFFETCGRTVYEAERECILSRENCIGIVPFVPNQEKCRSLCQSDKKCGYYKYIAPVEDSDGSGAGPIPKGRQIPISRLADADTPEFCYLLTSCSKRMIENVLCTIGANNFLDVKLFVPSLAACQQHCDHTDGCRYYYWYPIDYSAAPLYCYLFQQCAAKDDEPEVSLVVGGRHPGHYFIDSDNFNDIVTRSDVCPVKIGATEAGVKRAGASAQYFAGDVVLCGGRTGVESLYDCLRYDLDKETWSNHSKLQRPRDESAMVSVGSLLFIIGGIGEDTVEIWDDEDKEWKAGTDLPKPLARGCAVFTGDQILLTGGHDNSSTSSLSTVLGFSPDTAKWEPEPQMTEARRDHACVYLELERARGVLVTGGLGSEDQVLDSAEFFDLDKKEWVKVSSLKVARTEHTMSLIYGIPTVIGGVNGDEFLSSMEQFDKSGSSWNVPLQRDWRIINHVLSSPRYEHAVASIPISRISSCQNDIVEI